MITVPIPVQRVTYPNYTVVSIFLCRVFLEGLSITIVYEQHDKYMYACIILSICGG